METLERVYQPPFEEVFRKDYRLKGRWATEVFGNDHPLVLELGCGKGEYTVELARRHPEINFIGIDIKGARIWKGATTARDEGLGNVAFLRTRIEFTGSFFDTAEVSELWITFPDPQEKQRRRKKRLTGALFLNSYRRFLMNEGVVHLKTDNASLYNDTLALARYNQLPVERFTEDLYRQDWKDEALYIQTYYESKFRAAGAPIHYLKFRLPPEWEIRDPESYENQDNEPAYGTG